jgi:hypothetical protein
MISQAEEDSESRSSEEPVDETLGLKASRDEWHVPDQPWRADVQPARQLVRVTGRSSLYIAL